MTARDGAAIPAGTWPAVPAASTHPWEVYEINRHSGDPCWLVSRHRWRWTARRASARTSRPSVVRKFGDGGGVVATWRVTFGCGHVQIAAIKRVPPMARCRECQQLRDVRHAEPQSVPDEFAERWSDATKAGRCAVCATGNSHTASQCPDDKLPPARSGRARRFAFMFGDHR